MQKSIGDPSEPWCHCPCHGCWGMIVYYATPDNEPAPTLTEVARMSHTVLARIEAESQGPSESLLSVRRRPVLHN